METLSRNRCGQVDAETSECRRAREVERRIESENIVSSFECEATRRNGEVIWISQNARAVRDASGVWTPVEAAPEDCTALQRFSPAH